MNATKYLPNVLFMAAVLWCASVYTVELQQSIAHNDVAATVEVGTQPSINPAQSVKKNPRKRMQALPSSRKKKVTLKNMNKEELTDLLGRCKEKKDYTAAIKAAERLLKLSLDPEEIASMLFELACLEFDAGHFDKAIGYCSIFQDQYKGHAQLQDILYKRILSSFLITLDGERDQTRTKETIAFADDYLKQDTQHEKYVHEVNVLRTECFKKLASHELSVCTFYKKRGNIKAAQRRLAYVQTELLPELPDLGAELITLCAELGVEYTGSSRITHLPSFEESMLVASTAGTQNSVRSMRDRF